MHDIKPEQTLHLGFQMVMLAPMTLGEYNAYRDWTIPENEDQNQAGYLVEYLDDSAPNHANHAGYISWTPKDHGDTAYRPADGLTFGMAIEAVKQGKKISRLGWNGKDMFVAYMPALKLPPFNSDSVPRVNSRTAEHIGPDTPLDCQPYLAMFNAQKQWIVGWLATQSDMLANDWMIVDT